MHTHDEPPHTPIRRHGSKSSPAPITRIVVRLCGSCTAISGASSVSFYSPHTLFHIPRTKIDLCICFASTYTRLVHGQMYLAGSCARQSLASLLSPNLPQVFGVVVAHRPAKTAGQTSRPLPPNTRSLRTKEKQLDTTHRLSLISN